eukprot:5587817-Amphidinium_carterae.1
MCIRDRFRRRGVDQAAPLTVDQVMALESEVRSAVIPVSIQQRVFAGYCLCLLWLRSRWTDGQGMVEVNLDRSSDQVAYIEAVTSKTKTSRRAGLKALGWDLPLSGPMVVMAGEEWFDNWMADRVRSGLPSRRPAGGAFMPAPKPGSDGWLERPLLPSEGATWLVRIVGSTGAGGGKGKTHSLKVTCLSWMAKHGEDITMRRLLGYHVEAGDKSALTYSRDAMVGPLRKLMEAASLIKNPVSWICTK